MAHTKHDAVYEALTAAAFLAAEADESDTQTAIFLVMQGRQLPEPIRSRLINVIAQLVQLFELIAPRGEVQLRVKPSTFAPYSLDTVGSSAIE